MKKFISILLVVLTLLSLAACGTEQPSVPGSTPSTPAAPKQLNLADVFVAMTAKTSDMPEMMLVGEDMLLDLYGIKSEHYRQIQVYLCVNSLRADEIWLIEATDAEALAQLKTLAQNRLTAKDEESITYDPEQNAIVKQAHLETYGNYLVMIVSPEVQTLVAAFKAEAGV